MCTGPAWQNSIEIEIALLLCGCVCVCFLVPSQSCFCATHATRMHNYRPSRPSRKGTPATLVGIATVHSENNHQRVPLHWVVCATLREKYTATFICCANGRESSLQSSPAFFDREAA